MPSFVTFTHSWFGPRTMRSKTSVNSCIHLMGLARNMHELSIEVNAVEVLNVITVLNVIKS